MTNPELTPPGTAIYAIKARDAVIFSPHPRTKRTTNEVVRILRDVMEREGAPADVFQCVEEPSIPLSQELMAICDLTLATGGAGDGQGRLQLGQARLRCRRRQLDDGDRRNRRCRRGRPELPDVEDLRLRLRMLGRRQPAHRRSHLRRHDRPTASRGRLPRIRRGEGPPRSSDVGRRRHPDRGDRRPTRRQARRRRGIQHPG